MRPLPLILTFLAATASDAWDLNDVTLLYPLPRDEADSVFMKKIEDVMTVDQFFGMNPGGLIPSEGREGNIEIFRSMRALGVRVDPCFKDRFEQTCRKQIRVTWQPIRFDSRGTTTRDAALHTFHELSDEEFLEAIDRLREISRTYRALTERAPLGPHPALRKEGLLGSFAVQMGSYLDRFVRSENVSRVGWFLLAEMGIAWDFFTFDRDTSGDFKVQTIINIDKTNIPAYPEPVREMIMNSAKPTEYNSVARSEGFPPTRYTPDMKSDTDQLVDLVTDSQDPRVRNSESEKIRLYRMTFAIQNPQIHLPGTVDCISCHVTDGTQSWLERNLPYEIFKPLQMENRHPLAAKYNLQNLSQSLGNTKSFRALGYLGSAMAVSQRLINETAEVADSLNHADLSQPGDRPAQ